METSEITKKITVEMSTDFNQQRKYQCHSIGENTIFIKYNFVNIFIDFNAKLNLVKAMIDPVEWSSVTDEAQIAENMVCYSGYVNRLVNQGVAGSIPGFCSPSDGTINRGPVST